MKKKKPTVQITATVVGSAYVYSDYGPIVCPLCRVTVPKGTPHRCEKKA